MIFPSRPIRKIKRNRNPVLDTIEELTRDQTTNDKIRRSQNAVLGMFRYYGPMHHQSLVEKYNLLMRDYAPVPAFPNQSESGIRTRCRELVNKGLVEDTRTTVVLTMSGRRSKVWAASTAIVTDKNPEDDSGWSVFYIDGYRFRFTNVHDSRACTGRRCVVHSQSDHHMRSWPIVWRNDTSTFERICTHGVGHPDPDQFPFFAEFGLTHRSIHGCDGCCKSFLYVTPH